MARSRLLQAVAVVCALVTVAPAAASASGTQESVLQDDNQLVYASPSHVAETLAGLAVLGVERIRVSLIWALVAPNPTSTRRPNFDATDPAAYPRGAWDRYDTLVTEAHTLGISIDFNVTSPDPAWAATTVSPNIKYKDYSPSAAEFGQFVQAVATRYSGSYVDPALDPPPPPPPPPSGLPLPLPLPLGQTTTTTPAPITTPPPAPLPRVAYWEIWNEPNQGGWLSPQWRRSPRSSRRWIEASPVIYRGLVDAAWSALSDTGHGSDTFLIGNTSAKGSSHRGLLPAMAPITFLRALYCVGASDRPLKRTRAADLSCPVNGDPTAFARAHPGLLAATGYGHHPYSFKNPPNVRSADPTWATLADLPRLERNLKRIFARYGKPRPAGVPLYLTEYGYKSNPPNPFVKTSQAQQAEYINEGEYMAWQHPYVRALGQFELVDAGPATSEPVGSPAYWGTFQTGLIGLDGVVKPSYFAYRIPIWVPNPRRGPQVTVWGQLRPANHSALQFAAIQFKPARTGAYATIRHVQTASPQGFILAHVSLSSPGWLRLAWQNPANGRVYRSRTVRVR